MKKLFLAIFVSAFAFGFMSNETITVKGSDTMVILAQRWAEVYMAKHPNVTIQVTGGGSGVGISALINGTTDICNASRPMKQAEREKLKVRYNSLGVEIKTAKDGLSLYLHKSNPVKELTIDQIRKVYMGQIKNWKELGGQDARIILYGRENSSGTYVYFKDNVLGGVDFAGNLIGAPTGFSIGVGVNPGAINLDEELRRLDWKIEAGAEYVIPQPVFDLKLLESFLRRTEHIKMPVICGIWPLVSYRNAEFMNNEVPGASVPEEIMNRMRNAPGKEEAFPEGVRIARETFIHVRTMVQGVQLSAPLGRIDAVKLMLEA